MKHCKWICCWSLLVLAVAAAQPVMAVTDYVYVAVNGDSTVNVAVQGDSLSFGATCDVGATVYWEMWFDADSNETTGDDGDKIVMAFTTVDAGADPNGPPPDINPVPDGWYMSPNILLGFAPGHYVFVATDVSDGSSAERAFSMTALPTPPNTFSGTVTIEGVTAPDAQLANIWISADIEDGLQIWSALTDETGQYQMNLSDEATGQLFRISVEALPGYAQPGRVSDTANGDITGVDFAYALPADSIYGTVHDEYGNPIFPAYVWCSPQSGSGEKEYQVTDGSFVIYFSAAELGQWNLGVSGDMLYPNYMTPWSYFFDNSVMHGIYHELVCVSADTVVYARITEQGGQPTHQYRVQVSQDGLGQMTDGVSGTGADNILPLHVNRFGVTCNVSLSTWDDDYPIPDGYVVEGGNLKTVAVGDTATINFVLGNMVRDTIKLLPPDNVIDWSQVSVNLSGAGGNSNVHPDDNGVYTAYVSPGTYNINVWHDRFLALPNFRTVVVTGDTVGGMGFTLNYTNCHITGNITGLPLPLDTNLWIGATTGAPPDAYNTSGRVDAETGAFDFYVCDGSWQFVPPTIAGAHAPTAVNHVVLGTDTDYSFDFAYQPMMRVSGTVTVDPDDPPVVWNNVQVRLNGTGNYQVSPDDDCNFTIYADTGMYMLDAYYVGYLTTPGGYFNIHLLADTSGFDFTLNQRDINVQGYLQGVTLPIQGGPYNLAAGTAVYPAGYHVASEAVVNATGEYHMTVCDGVWTITAPDIAGYVTPAGQTITLTDAVTDTTVNFVYEPIVYHVSGTVTADPDDSPVTLTDVLVRLSGPGGLVEGAPDVGGEFTLDADTGVYGLSAFLADFLTTPALYNLHVLADTAGGLDFLLNERDIHVHGHLIDVALPLPGGTYNISCETDTYPAGYHAASEAVINATGEWHAWVCDGDWTFTPPDIPGYVTPLAGYRELTELDTVSALDFSYTPSSVDDPLTPSIPREFNLAQNSPNPFNMATRIDFDLPKSVDIELAVYNILGQKVITLAQGTFAAGTHSVGWDGLDKNGTIVSTGLYFYRLNAGDRVMVR
ncbi:MAG: FlgD immunoglobulin-like domain containing protein, partial [candidate division Zixibacteria bacterium]|nr:FlgD immunoglobulin-like domain containing protein [candidate division Zixibacteria bacterium]